MILLDTNVVSALMRLHLEPVVPIWLAKQPVDSLRTSAPSVFELRFGIETRPVGERRQALEAAYAEIVDGLLGGRVLFLDRKAADSAATVRTIQKQRGRNISIPDCQIAGIALTQGLPLATRNRDDFVDLGIELVNPWILTD